MRVVTHEQSSYLANRRLQAPSQTSEKNKSNILENKSIIKSLVAAEQHRL